MLDVGFLCYKKGHTIEIGLAVAAPLSSANPIFPFAVVVTPPNPIGIVV